MANQTTSAHGSSHPALVDLPGIGPTKAEWLTQAGIHDIDDLRRIPAERLAHVRGIGSVVATMLKDLVALPDEKLVETLRELSRARAAAATTEAATAEPAPPGQGAPSAEEQAMATRADTRSGQSVEAAPTGAAEATKATEQEPRPGREELTEPQILWKDDVSALVEAVETMAEHLRANPDALGLKGKFVKELRRVSEVIGTIPLAEPPDDATQRGKISKHTKAIRALLESTAQVDSLGKNHQKVLMEKLKTRRRKLGKWV